MFQFPIKGIIGEILLILEWIIFFHRVKKYNKKLRSLQEKGYVLLFLGFSLMWLFFIISDYYVTNFTLRLIILNCGYTTLMIGTLIFIYTIEKYKNFKKKYLFTIIFLINIMIYILIAIFALEFTQLISSTFWPIFIVFFIFYSKELHLIFEKNHILVTYKNEYIKLVLGVGLLVLGFSLTTDFIINIFGLIPRIIGDSIQICAIFFLFWFLISIPSFLEYEWKEKVEDLFIIHKSGLLIYQKSFKIKDENQYDPYISGLITSIKMMLESIDKEENISFIEKKEKIVIIQTGKYVYGVLVSKLKLDYVLLLLNNFI